MPPQLSDDEASDVSAQITSKPTPKKAQATTPAKEEPKPVVEDEENEDDEEDDEVGEDEYVVEKIISHMIDEDGTIKFEVKWEGYSKKSDRTWEPEENLETAKLIVDAYLTSIGGKEALLKSYEEKKAQSSEKKGKKRGRSSTTTDPAAVNGAKKGKKNGSHPASSTPPASSKEFRPPSGNWEEEVVGIDACEGAEGKIVVYLTWKSGDKSQHPLHQVYKRCPQRMLKFYENHLVFKKTDEDAA